MLYNELGILLYKEGTTMGKRVTNQRKKIVIAAFTLAADRPWTDITLAEIACEAGVELKYVYKEFPQRIELVKELLFGGNETWVADNYPENENEPPHDRLVDTLMCYFDHLSHNRAAMQSILRSSVNDPSLSIGLLPTILQMMAWMLETSGISSGGIAGSLRVKGLSVVYFMTLRVWMGDESSDLGKTMAFLDKRLRAAEQLASLLPGIQVNS